MKLDLRAVLEELRCPRCLGRLIVPDAVLTPIPEQLPDPDEVETVPYITEDDERIVCTECEQDYALCDGLPVMLFEALRHSEDKQWQGEYDERAAEYDRIIKLLVKWLGIDYEAEQAKLISRLELRPGMKVLEVSVGSGRNLSDLASAVGPGGTIYGIDLSSGMLGVAQKRVRQLPVDVALIRANGAALPFASGRFDAVLHVGGLNTFSFIGRALAELVRVAKPGAKVVVVDEGMPEGVRQDRWYTEIVKTNTLYAKRPPLELVPFPELSEFDLDWVWRRLFYVLDMRKRG